MEEYTFPKHMKRILKLIERLAQKPVWEMTSEEISRINNTTIPNNALTRKLLDKPAKGIQKKTLRIPVDSTTIPAYLFTRMERPNQSLRQGHDPLPIIVFYHGGGWVIGHTVLNDFFCSRLASLTDSVVLSIDYRLAPSYKFPTAVNDSYTALEWAALHAPAWGADPERLFVMGGSAGGNLAAVMCLKAKAQRGPKIQGQILIYPVTDGRMLTRSYTTHAQAPQLDKKSMEFFIDSYKASDEDITHPYFSPLLAEDHTDLPPALIITAEYDPLHDEGIQYGEKLQKDGVPVRFLDCKQTIHGFINYPKANGVPEMEEQVVSFIEAYS